MRLEDGEAGLAARTIARRLSSVRGLYAYLCGPRGHRRVAATRCPTSLATRRPGARRGKGGVPLIRTPRTLPRVLAPVEVDALRGERCAPTATGPWSTRWCWAACAAARCSACAWRTSTPASDACSWPRARAAASGSCRCRRASSPRWADYLETSGRRGRRPRSCSWC